MPGLDERTLKIVKQPTQAIEPHRELFPAAQVAGATSVADVLAAWKERGLEPQEVSRADILQWIKIEHDPLDGKLKWTTSGLMDGMMAILLAVQTAISMGEYFLQGAGRVDMPSGEAAVVIAFRDGRLSFDITPKDNQLAAEKLVAALLAYWWAKTNGHPLDQFMGAFGYAPAP